VLAIGVLQQSVYQRKTFLERPRAPHGLGAGGQLHASRRHLKDVRAAGCVEHFRPLQTKRKPVDGETPLATPLRGRTGTEA
jgi:hypothetical protein